MAASEKQKELSTIIKTVHQNLRESAEYGVEEAWEQHLQKSDTLEMYAKVMKNLSEIWEQNAKNEVNSGAKSRINWIVDYCIMYFFTQKIYLEKREKEKRILQKCSNLYNEINFNELCIKNIEKLNVLDVGSCFNPFSEIESFNVIALDLCPVNETVYKGDFLKINLNNYFEINSCTNEILTLRKNYFDCVIFSLLLEYLPSSEQRIKCCQNAYDVLKYEGILIIITPDSQNVGKNAKLMKNWRYTLGKIGFSRIKFEKLPHITCLVFRKSLHKFISEQWSNLHKDDYMNFCIEIPQEK